jgi:hypothetical protein
MKTRVIGRVKVEVGGKTVRLEMRKDGVYVRVLRKRKVYRASLVDIAWLALGQEHLRFEPTGTP